MILGRVDEVDGHFVATRFVALAIPTASLYVAPKGARPAGEGLPIRTSFRSIAAGYARFWFPILAVTAPFAQAVSGHVGVATWVASAVLLVGAGAAYRSGRLPEEQKARLRLLGTVTGLRIDPHRLRPTTRDLKLASLGGLMDKAGIPTTHDGILSVLDTIPGPAMPLVYGYARYAGDDADWQNCADVVYTRHTQEF